MPANQSEAFDHALGHWPLSLRGNKTDWPAIGTVPHHLAIELAPTKAAEQVFLVI